MASYSLRDAKRRWPKIILLAALMLLILGAGTIWLVRNTYHANLKPVSASQKNLSVTIPSGATVHDTAVILKNAGVIRAVWAFEWYIRNHDLRDKVQAGTYTLRPNQSVPDIATILTQGKITTDLITILPAQRLDQVRQALINSGFGQAAVDRALKPELYENHPALVDKPIGASLEGYLYPESFQKTADTKPEVIIRASLDEMQKYLTPDLRAKIVKQGLTVHQGVILASIIEQEVSNPADKAVVAQVFLKRLREERALESDPTAIYGAVLAGETPSLTFDSAYNTYKHQGLPPTPISNVSQSSLVAVAQPSNSEYLYFVAGDDGKTYFSTTLEEHQRLTREHCKTLCR